MNAADEHITLNFLDELPYEGHIVVNMPPNWRSKEEVPYTFVFMNEEITPDQYTFFYENASKYGLINSRIFTPRILSYTSLFHPRFFHALKHHEKENDICIKSLKERKFTHLKKGKTNVNLTLFWLQSMLFLSGVTLSAAIIQDRWSLGTIESKLNRLWQASQIIQSLPSCQLSSNEVRDFVLMSADQFKDNPKLILKKIKKFYSKLLFDVSKNLSSGTKVMLPKILNSEERERFGFLDHLKELLDKNLVSVILYGSATNSLSFSDYDIIIVVDDIDLGISKLASLSPTYKGVELNISIYDTTDFWIYQLISGDNLYDHAICLYGKIDVPHKDQYTLLKRNFSFGFIRFRQLMGMGSHINEGVEVDNDDKRNLLDYFIKIPLNICKGIEGCLGNISTNEQIKIWAKEHLNFDVEDLKKQSRNGDHISAIATSTWAAQEILHHFDEKLNLTYYPN